MRAVVPLLLLLGACKKTEPTDFALEDTVVLTRPDSEDAFVIGRLVNKGAFTALPVAKMSVKNGKGVAIEVGTCESPATSILPGQGAWCMFAAREQRSFVDFSMRFEPRAAPSKKPQPLTANDTTILASVGPETPKVTGNVINTGAATVKWLGTIALARNAAGKIVGGGLQREGIPLEAGRSHDVLMPLLFLTEKPAKIELVPYGEEP